MRIRFVRNVTLPIVLLALGAVGIGRAIAAPATCAVTIRPDEKIGEVNPMFFGVNTLYNIDTKPTLADERFITKLREMPVHLIRFPGGDVADNYLWEDNKVEDPAHYPNKAPPDAADTDAFIAMCRKVGAEPMFVINLETGFIKNDNSLSAKRAADWVKYCKDRNYNVRRWEIGNETYLYSPGHHKRVRVTPQQYADAFVAVVKAMKAVDGSIQCGAVGPQSATKSANNKLADGTEMNPPLPVWWPTVLATAGPFIDFVIVHEYAGRAGLTYDKFVKEGPPGGKDFPGLRKFVESKLGRHVPMALTEWNIAPDLPLKGIATVQIRAAMIANYLTVGVDAATIWPLRINGKSSDRGVFTVKSLETLPAYDLLQLYSKNIGKTIVKSSASVNTVTHFATLSEDGHSIVVFLVSRSTENEPQSIALDLGSFTASKAAGEALTAISLDSAKIQHVPLTAKGQGSLWECTLPPFSVGMLRLEK